MQSAGKRSMIERQARRIAHHRRTAGWSPENGEFVPKHDDSQVLEIVRPKT
jgi:hypothetical protein